MSYPRLPFLSTVESVDEGTKAAKGGVSELLSEASMLLSSSSSSNAAPGRLNEIYFRSLNIIYIGKFKRNLLTFRFKGLS